MNLYLLKRIGRKTKKWDVAEGFVVCSKTEEEARLFAAGHAGDEGRDTWIKSRLSSCEKIGNALQTALSGVVLRDYSAG